MAISTMISGLFGMSVDEKSRSSVKPANTMRHLTRALARVCRFTRMGVRTEG
ncbi:MAG TPA: hypothetical protein VN426_18275 [Syntrophomonadaceae bacterium]|nr:hypothetical protein [Syntrophomonadaceae bacterium]